MATGLQTIINSCNGIKMNRRKVVGVQYTRNEIPRVSQTPTKNPWKITLDMPNSFKYSDARALMEELDTLDQTTPQVVTFGDNPNLRWIFAYQGLLNSSQFLLYDGPHFTTPGQTSDTGVFTDYPSGYLQITGSLTSS